MASATATSDLKLTEQFLLDQQDVLDASVWMDRGRILAHVTVCTDYSWDTEKLRGLCATYVGTRATPDEIQIISNGSL